MNVHQSIAHALASQYEKTAWTQAHHDNTHVAGANRTECTSIYRACNAFMRYGNTEACLQDQL